MKPQLQEEWLVSLPEGFTTRGATMDDLNAAFELFKRWSMRVK